MRIQTVHDVAVVDSPAFPRRHPPQKSLSPGSKSNPRVWRLSLSANRSIDDRVCSCERCTAVSRGQGGLPAATFAIQVDFGFGAFPVRYKNHVFETRRRKLAWSKGCILAFVNTVRLHKPLQSRLAGVAMEHGFPPCCFRSKRPDSHQRAAMRAGFVPSSQARIRSANLTSATFHK